MALIVVLVIIGFTANLVHSMNFEALKNLSIWRPNNDDERTMLVPEIIAKHNYPVEVHNVVTEDDYILTMHRIPHGRTSRAGKGAVLVMHGVLASSADWIICGPSQGIGYILADEGYDVWLGNARGNRYSKNHTTLDIKSSAFWNFSWHEIGIHDIPAMIDHILEVTGEHKIFYIGHSQGTTTFFVMCTERPQYNDKIRAQFSMAPVAYVGHMKSPLVRLLATGEGITEKLLPLIGVHEFMPNGGFISKLGEKVCRTAKVASVVCSNILFLVCGFDHQQLNDTIVPLIMAHLPAGSSTKQLLHYAQEVHSNQFRKFDYGFFANFKIYGSRTPPSYDLSKITAPIYLYYSTNDWVSSYKDVLRLAPRLKNLKGKFLISYTNFNHLDYLFGIDAPTLVYEKIISLMTRH